MKYIYVVLISALFLCGCNFFSNESEDVNNAKTTCKVRQVDGVPQIVLNGRPVRPRMLYVSPLYFKLGSPIKRDAYPELTETFVEILPLEKDADGVRIQLEFGGRFDCKIYALEVSQADGGAKVFSLGRGTSIEKSGGKNLQAEFVAKAGENQSYLHAKSDSGVSKIAFGNVDFKAGKKYRIDIKIESDKKPTAFKLYTTLGGDFFEPVHRSFVGLQTKLAKDAGVDFITFPVQAADFMPEDGKSYNTENLKGALDEILGANPNAKIIVRVRCYPPDWWMKKYPQDALQSIDGKVCDKFPGMGSPFSPRFRADIAKALGAVIDFCEGYCGNNIAGYHPGGANSCEWFYPDTRDTDWVGYEPSAQQSWREWLTRKYGTDAALQKAWNDPSATLATAKVPSPKERLSAFCIVDPKTQMKLFDCNMFRQDSMVDTILTLAKVIRKKTPEKLSLVFYGYITIGEWKGAANPGHFGLMKVLNSPDVDILCGPLSYHDTRNLGYGGMTPSSTETITRSGKLWISEDDIRTYRVPPTQQKITPLGKELRTLEDTLSVLQRDMAQQVVRNNGCWWMDLAGTGWFDDPKLWTLMSKFAAVDNDLLENPVEYNPDIAIILDERSVCFGGANFTNLRTMLSSTDSRKILTDCAVTFGSFLLDDVLYGRPYTPRLSIFAVSCALDAKQRKAIRQKVADSGAIFVWTTGLIDVEKSEFSLAGVSEATGFDVEYVKGGALPMLVEPTADGRKMGLVKFGHSAKTSPLLTPILKDGDKVLGVYPNGQPALVLRGKHLFCGSGVLPKEVIRLMFKVAGVREYSNQKLSVFANEPYVSITCTDDDKNPHDIMLNLHSDKEVFDALSGEHLGKGPFITLKMKRGDNRLLRLGKLKCR